MGENPYKNNRRTLTYVPESGFIGVGVFFEMGFFEMGELVGWS